MGIETTGARVGEIVSLRFEEPQWGLKLQKPGQISDDIFDSKNPNGDWNSNKTVTLSFDCRFEEPQWGLKPSPFDAENSFIPDSKNPNGDWNSSSNDTAAVNI